MIWDLFNSGLTSNEINESFIPVVTDILNHKSGGPRYGIMKVKLGTKLSNNYCQNHENDRLHHHAVPEYCIFRFNIGIVL